MEAQQVWGKVKCWTFLFQNGPLEPYITGCPDKGSISTTRDYSIHDNISDGTPLMTKSYKLNKRYIFP